MIFESLTETGLGIEQWPVPVATLTQSWGEFATKQTKIVSVEGQQTTCSIQFDGRGGPDEIRHCDKEQLRKLFEPRGRSSGPQKQHCERTLASCKFLKEFRE